MTHRAGVLLFQENTVLLIRRFRPEAGVYYVVPGGRTEPGESDEAAAVREMMEETGLEVEVGPVLFEQDNEEYGQRQIFFGGRIVSGAVTPEIGGEERERQSAENTFEIGWVPLASVRDLPLYPEGVKNFLIKQVGSQASGS